MAPPLPPARRWTFCELAAGTLYRAVPRAALPRLLREGLPPTTAATRAAPPAPAERVVGILPGCAADYFAPAGAPGTFRNQGTVPPACLCIVPPAHVPGSPPPALYHHTPPRPAPPPRKGERPIAEEPPCPACGARDWGATREGYPACRACGLVREEAPLAGAPFTKAGAPAASPLAPGRQVGAGPAERARAPLLARAAKWEARAAAPYREQVHGWVASRVKQLLAELQLPAGLEADARRAALAIVDPALGASTREAAPDVAALAGIYQAATSRGMTLSDRAVDALLRARYPQINARNFWHLARAGTGTPLAQATRLAGSVNRLLAANPTFPPGVQATIRAAAAQLPPSVSIHSADVAALLIAWAALQAADLAWEGGAGDKRGKVTGSALSQSMGYAGDIVTQSRARTQSAGEFARAIAPLVRAAAGGAPEQLLLAARPVAPPPRRATRPRPRAGPPAGAAPTLPRAAELYLGGLTVAQVAKTTGATPAAARHAIRAAGVPLRPPGPHPGAGAAAPQVDAFEVRRLRSVGRSSKFIKK